MDEECTGVVSLRGRFRYNSRISLRGRPSFSQEQACYYGGQLSDHERESAPKLTVVSPSASCVAPLPSVCARASMS